MSRDDEVVDPDEVGPRLFLLTPGAPSGDFVAVLDEALAGGEVAGVLVCEPNPLTTAAVCARRGVAWFLADLDRALELGADGVLLDGREDIEAVRSRLGADRLIGTCCGTSRHAAMVVGEAGADFVAFGGQDHALSKRLVDLIAWWNALFVLPSLALGRFDPHAAAVLVEAGADLIAVHIEDDLHFLEALSAFRDVIRP